MSDFRHSTGAPSPPLAGLVDHFWALNDAPSHSHERVIPSGTIELVINLREDEFRIHRAAQKSSEIPLATSGKTELTATQLNGAIVSGAYSHAFVVETRAHASIVGVHFTPGGAAAFLGVPAGALANAHVELDALWGRRAFELRERLSLTADPTARFRILEEALLQRMSSRPRAVRAEIAFALVHLGAPSVAIAEVAERVQLSHRRFIEVFLAEVGMTPKRYAMVRRFQRALDLATAGTRDWAQIALDCGYFDQAHLCHDWLAFTGLSPVDFVRMRNVRVKDNHVAAPPALGSNFSNPLSLTAPTLAAKRERHDSRDF